MSKNNMNLQDFACRISDIVWGGELAWDRRDGLKLLVDAVAEEYSSRRPHRPSIRRIGRGATEDCK